MDYFFVFANDIYKMIENKEFIYGGDLSYTKGLSIGIKKVMINLSADQFKGVDEDILIKEIGKSLTHETLHCIINEDARITADGEEKIVQILAGQLALNLHPK